MYAGPKLRIEALYQLNLAGTGLRWGGSESKRIQERMEIIENLNDKSFPRYRDMMRSRHQEAFLRNKR